MTLHRVWLVALVAGSLGSGCIAGLDGTEPDDDDDGGGARACQDIFGERIDLAEDRSVYEQDRIEVLVIDLEVADAEGLAAVQANQPGAEVAATFAADSEDGVVEAPARLELRGNSSRLANQKSYKVHLQDAVWRGHAEINLNKHPYDLTRVRNQLSFELFRSVPHMSSLRTQFVQLYINGEDHGLYTQIEEPEEDFLASHGLDPDGTLYKANRWEIFPIDDATVADAAAMELLVDAKANPDPEKLAAMAAAVSDWSRGIDDVINEHFHRDNYVTWLALQLLLGNFDTRDQNYFLYSPEGCSTWYFLPWDYDGALGFYEQPRQLAAGLVRPRWRSGPANWWGTGLHERFFRDPNNLGDVRKAMDRLLDDQLAPDRVAALLDSYRPVVRGQVEQSPDLWNLPVLRGTSDPADIMEQWETEYDRIYQVIDMFDAEYRAAVEWPMPVFLWEESEGDLMHFEWSPSFDFQDDAITYDFELAIAPDFAEESIVERQVGLVDTWVQVAPLAAGDYYWRVLIREAGHPDSWQVSFETARLLVVQ